MQINYELIGILIAVVIQGLYLAFKMGRFEQKLETLEQKQDKHNNLIELKYRHRYLAGRKKAENKLLF